MNEQSLTATTTTTTTASTACISKKKRRTTTKEMLKKTKKTTNDIIEVSEGKKIKNRGILKCITLLPFKATIDKKILKIATNKVNYV